MSELLTRELVEFLTSSVHSDVCASIRRIEAKYGDALRIQTALRAEFPALPHAYLAAALDQHALRARAARRLALHPDSLYTRTALEQASSASAAGLHAGLLTTARLSSDGHSRERQRDSADASRESWPQNEASAETRFPTARDRGGGHACGNDTAAKLLVEICSGIGSDSAALSEVASQLVCIESDDAVARLLRHNLALLGRTNVLVLRGTAERWMPSLNLANIDGIFADPSRRMDGRRRTDAEQASPPLSWLRTLAERAPRTVVKIAPGDDIDDPFWSRMFVAVGDECSEQLLTRGCDLPPVCAIDAASREMWAPGRGSRVSDAELFMFASSDEKPSDRSPHPTNTDRSADSAHTATAGGDNTAEGAGRTAHDAGHQALAPLDARFIIEPHGAIIRTGCVAEYLAEVGAQVFDPHIAYGIAAHEPAPSRWHARFRVIEALPWQRARVNAALRAHGFGPRTDIKKRGFRQTAEEVRSLLRFPGDRAGVVILTRVGEKHLAFLCERV